MSINPNELPENLLPDGLGQSYGELLDQHDPAADPMPEPPPEATPAAEEQPPEESVSPPPPLRIIEAMLFLGGEPLEAARAGEIIRGLTREQFLQAIATLEQLYRRQGRPYSIQPRGSGYALQLRPRYSRIQQGLFGGLREARLSHAAIDVLALVAYRQPATRPEIDTWRGADSAALLRQLVRHGLVAIVQRGEAGQREVSYGTTPRFLEMFGLHSLDDLPRTQDLQQI